VHFTATLYVIRPVTASQGNGVLLFEIANRGGKGLLGGFNGGAPAQDPIAAANVGDGFLMRARDRGGDDPNAVEDTGSRRSRRPGGYLAHG
jgi:hypothetical protein